MPKQKTLVRFNDRRAGWALAAVQTFIGETGVDDVETGIGDLLGDIMHLCDREGLSFQKLLRKGRGYYNEETSSVCKVCKRNYDFMADSGHGDDCCCECNPEKSK